jgi:hypothetical protein
MKIIKGVIAKEVVGVRTDLAGCKFRSECLVIHPKIDVNYE